MTRQQMIDNAIAELTAIMEARMNLGLAMLDVIALEIAE